MRLSVFTDSFDLEFARAHWYVVMGDSDIY